MRLRNVFIAVAALSLAACSTTGLTPSLSTSAQVTAAKAEYSAETAVNVADEAYLSAESYLSPTLKSQVKGLLAQAHDAIVAARAAEVLGDTATVSAKVDAVIQLKAEVLSIVQPGPAPDPSPAT